MQLLTPQQGTVLEVKDRSYYPGGSNNPHLDVIKIYDLVVRVYADDDPPKVGSTLAMMAIQEPC